MMELERVAVGNAWNFCCQTFKDLRKTSRSQPLVSAVLVQNHPSWSFFGQQDASECALNRVLLDSALEV